MLAARAFRGAALRAPFASSSTYAPSISTRRWRSGQAQAGTPEAPTQRRMRQVDAPPTVAPAGVSTPSARPVPAPATVAGADARAPAAAVQKTGMSTEDQMRNMEKILDMADMSGDIDVWNQPIPLMDVRIPHADVKWTRRADWPKKRDNLKDWVKNAAAMYEMAKFKAFPGVDVKSTWTRKVFHATSTAPDAWVAGLRAQFLESYVKLNEAITANNLLAIKRYSAGTYAQRARKLARRCGARKDQYYSWELLGERSPCAIVSLRATEANNSPRLGPGTSRSIVHALVRLDTRQHLIARERKGGRYLIDEQREVVEHLVFERRLWQDGAPWVIRDQVWEGAPAEFADFSEQAAEPKPKKK